MVSTLTICQIKGGNKMILVDFQIRDIVKEGLLVIDNFDEKCVQPASYDMRIGKNVFVSTKGDVIDLTKNGGYFILDPGAVASISTHEYLELPDNIVGRLGIKSGLARQGLFSSVGIQADPGFKGCLFINLINLTSLPVPLDYLDTFLSIEFSKLDVKPRESYKGPYQGKRDITANDIKPLLAYEGLNLAQIHKGFAELSENIKAVASFSERLEKLIELHEKQMEKVMSHNTQLVNEIKKLVQHISEQKEESTVILRSVDRVQALKEIEALFKEGETLYYSDVAEKLGLDLELVVDICNDLEDKGIIGMLK